QTPRLRQAACLACRRSKIKCNWDPDDERCKRCARLDTECMRLVYQPGRQKGIKNKRRGLDKALYQIDQAVKRAQSGSQEDHQVLDQLRRYLKSNASDRLNSSSSVLPNGSAGPAPDADADETMSDEKDDEDDEDIVPHIIQGNGDTLAINDAENPLQLLARASYLQAPRESRHGKSPQSAQSTAAAKPKSPANELQAFFAPARANLDVGDDIDPISLGLVSDEEAESLFTFFYQNLAHTRWGLDPRLYTTAFTRSRSAFLFTSILAASALFMPSCAALSKRLSNHAKGLAHRVFTHRHKSVEIVLAFLVNIPWMFPGKQSTDDETCTYISMATTVATDMSLHKSILSLDMLELNARLGITRADDLDPRAALAIDGFSELDPQSDMGRLLLRSRERCWISFMSLARGRPFSVPITRSLKDCDNWPHSDLADPQDGPLVSMAVLRRDLDGLFAAVRALCDESLNPSIDGSLVCESIQGAIERFFEQWFTAWATSIKHIDGRLPPYVEILVTHTRLSIYGGVINHPTAPLEVRRFFHTAGLSSALSVMRVAIQGEPQLQSMPNNTAIMISFAACFALTLSAHAAGESALAPSVRNLIEETATVLIRIGSVTKHRNGLSVLYGEYLKQIVKRSGKHSEAPKTNTFESILGTEAPQNTLPVPTTLPDQDPLWSETFQFSAMSDAQIQHILNQPGNDLAPSFDGVSWEDMTNFEWLYWPDIGI
ncbi:hypothetical protein S7711_03477, partial [Stachybotrys chartarum IBT 7711]